MDENEMSLKEYDTTMKLDLSSMEKKFVKIYKLLPHLWNPNHPDYNNRFKRNAGYDALLPLFRRYMPEATRFHIRQKINILRSCYRKELRKHLASRTIDSDGNVVYAHVPSSWKFRALRFLDCEKANNAMDASKYSNRDTCPDYEEEQELEFLDTTELESGNEEPDTSKVTISPDYVDGENSYLKRRKRSRANISCSSEDDVLEREFNAVGANVACKLQRMNVQQRYHAELLINKVLIRGLKECLTENTDLSDSWPAQLQDSFSYKEQDTKHDTNDASNHSTNDDNDTYISIN